MFDMFDVFLLMAACFVALWVLLDEIAEAQIGGIK